MRDRHVRRGLLRRQVGLAATDLLLFHVDPHDLGVLGRDGLRGIAKNIDQDDSPYPAGGGAAGMGGFGGIAAPGVPAWVACAPSCDCILWRCI